MSASNPKLPTEYTPTASGGASNKAVAVSDEELLAAAIEATDPTPVAHRQAPRLFGRVLVGFRVAGLFYTGEAVWLDIDFPTSVPFGTAIEPIWIDLGAEFVATYKAVGSAANAVQVQARTRVGKLLAGLLTAPAQAGGRP